MWGGVAMAQSGGEWIWCLLFATDTAIIVDERRG